MSTCDFERFFCFLFFLSELLFMIRRRPGSGHHCWDTTNLESYIKMGGKKGSKQKHGSHKQQHCFCFALQPWQLPPAHPRCHVSVGNTLLSLNGPIYSALKCKIMQVCSGACVFFFWGGHSQLPNLLPRGTANLSNNTKRRESDFCWWWQHHASYATPSAGAAHTEYWLVISPSKFSGNHQSLRHTINRKSILQAAHVVTRFHQCWWTFAVCVDMFFCVCVKI